MFASSDTVARVVENKQMNIGKMMEDVASAVKYDSFPFGGIVLAVTDYVLVHSNFSLL